MRIVFLGVGEAYDENYVNNSHIIDSDSKLLLDCGYSVPRHLWKHFPSEEFLDAVYLSHAHADHYLGVPVLLARMQDQGRKKPLKIICQPEICEYLPNLIKYAHINLSEKLEFPIEYIEVRKEHSINFNELKLEFALTKHSINNFAIKVTTNDKTVCYSGDGNFSEASKHLYVKADLVIHETFTLEEAKNGHASIKDVIEMCNEVGVKTLALTHLDRELRKQKDVVLGYVNNAAQNVNVILPEPLDDFTI